MRRTGQHAERPPRRPTSQQRASSLEASVPASRVVLDFRALLLVPLLSLIVIVWGVDAAIDGDRRWGHRLNGLAAAASGVLFATSLWLYLRPGPLADHEWRVSAGRRRLGYAFRHAWLWVLLAAATLSIWAKVTD